VGKQIEKMINPSAPADERDRRRRRLTKGPLEFRENRADLPKAKGKWPALVRSDVEILPGPCHIVGVAQSPQPYDLVTRPSTIHAGRFRWDIRQNGRPVQSSMEAFASEQEAHMDGRLELEKLMQVSRLNR
jgi:hypothetical protein